MVGVIWADFDIDTALERDILQSSLQAIDRAHGSRNSTIYLQNGSRQISRTITDHVGMSPADCVDRLKIRPLLVGVAWKVLDLLLEHALANVGQVRRRWSIEAKVEEKRYGPARPGSFPALEWQAVMATYAETHQLRNSLTHRKVFTDPAGSLVGIDDKTGAALRGLTVIEQEAFAHVALLAAELVIGGTSDGRAIGAMDYHLIQLVALHKVVLPPGSAAPIPECIVYAEAMTDGSRRYRLDLDQPRVDGDFRDHPFGNVTVRLPDRPGLELRCRLEEAPAGAIVFDIRNPPAWLTR